MSIIIPSSPSDRENITKVIAEISNSFARIDSEKDYIKEAIDALEEKYELPKKHLRKVAVAYHKQNIQETQESNSDLEDLYDALFVSNAA